MNKIVFGKYVNTHGLDGEIKILSNFKYKERVLQVNKEIIIDNIAYLIETYRPHQKYDMVRLKGINKIEEIPFRKNSFVYINKDLYLDDNDYVDDDLIGFVALNSYFRDVVIDIYYLNGNKKVLKLRDHLLPIELIDKIDFDKKIIKVKEVEGL